MNVESIIHFKQQEDESSDMDLSGDEDEEFVDASGYFGVQHRQKVDAPSQRFDWNVAQQHRDKDVDGIACRVGNARRVG